MPSPDIKNPGPGPHDKPEATVTMNEASTATIKTAHFDRKERDLGIDPATGIVFDVDGFAVHVYVDGGSIIVNSGSDPMLVAPRSSNAITIKRGAR